MTVSRRLKRKAEKPTSTLLKKRQTKVGGKNGLASYFLFLCGCIFSFHWMTTDITKDYAVLVPKFVQKLENCSLSFIPPPPRKESEWRKPLWITAFPASGSSSPSKQGDLIKELIEAMTFPSAVKNYHSSIRNKLRRCRGISETVGCSQAHPYVDVQAEKQIKNFQSQVIFVLRNPATVFPASFDDKNIAYHHGHRADENEWRRTRDQYLKTSIKSWREMLMWWLNSDFYRIALFVPYERLVNPETGPKLVSSLANEIKKSGFEVAPENDISCIWYRVAKKEWQRQKEMMNYVPGYTREQQSYILKELKDLMQEISSRGETKDDDLLSILKDYHAHVHDDLRLDQTWSNHSINQ